MKLGTNQIQIVIEPYSSDKHENPLTKLGISAIVKF